MQAALSHLDWITPQPPHFLHVWLGGVAFGPCRPAADEIGLVLRRAEHAWSEIEPFEVSYRRINCFHSTVVTEVEGDGPRTLVGKLVDSGYWRDLPVARPLPGVPMDTFLAHVTFGTVNQAHDPARLRDALVALRESRLGSQRVLDASLCVIPASRSTVLDPWEVVGSVTFRPSS